MLLSNLKRQLKRLLNIKKSILSEAMYYFELIQILPYAENVPVLITICLIVQIQTINPIVIENKSINFMKSSNQLNIKTNRNSLETRIQQLGTNINLLNPTHKEITGNPIVNLLQTMHKKTKVIPLLFKIIQPKVVLNMTLLELNHLLNQFLQTNQ